MHSFCNLYCCSSDFISELNLFIDASYTALFSSVYVVIPSLFIFILFTPADLRDRLNYGTLLRVKSYHLAYHRIPEILFAVHAFGIGARLVANGGSIFIVYRLFLKIKTTIPATINAPIIHIAVRIKRFFNICFQV